jgi:serine/threonine-protein kinase
VEASTLSPRAVQTFGRYTLVERIGAGGMAEVFLAIVAGPEGFRRSLVIKRMLPQLSHDTEFVRMFVDEAKVSALLSHPNLVQVFEFGKVEDSYFIAMEYVHGRTLTAIMAELANRQRQMPIAASVEIARQVCSGLDYAHALQGPDGKPLGIVHRDISPPNLMVDRHGVAKILDFGIARVADELREVRTRVGTMKGKISYMSPEQLNLHDIDHRSDIFAIGVVLHELLTGQRLFRANNDYTSSRMVLEAEIRRPSSVNPAVPAALDQVVMRALERDRDLRYPTAGEMASALEDVMRESSLPSQEQGKLLAELFPADVADKGLAASGAYSEPKPAPLATPDENGTLVAQPLGISAATPAAIPAGGLPSGETAPPRARGRRIALAATAVAAVGLLAATPLVRRLRLEASRPSAPAIEQASAPPIARASAPAPVAQTVSLSIDSTPQDAEVTRIDSDRPLGRTPLTIVQSRSTQVIELRIERAGYATASYKIIPDLDKAVRIDLLRLPPEREPKPPSEAIASRPVARAAAPKKLPHPGPPTPAVVVDDGRPCFLTVGSFPWARLWIDGKDSGQPTPVVHLQVPCGAHKLRFKRDDAEIDQVVHIVVTADREFRQNFELESSDTDG